MEESPIAQEAIRRLPEMEGYARIYRMRRAIHTDASQDILPQDQWTKPEEVSESLMAAIWPTHPARHTGAR